MTQKLPSRTEIIATMLSDLKELWPNGPNSMEQHRDLVHTWLMGYASSLKINDNIVSLRTWVEQFKDTATKGWFPTGEFVWWEVTFI